MLRDALVRVSRGEGQPVYIIDTEFGGGKTHTHITLSFFLCLLQREIKHYKILFIWYIIINSGFSI